jgi:low affinity Fe/Cu permease
MDIPPFRTLLTKMGVLTSTPVFFVLAGVFMASWAFFSSEGIGWREIATMATLFMTILIQRAEHRDTQALHAKLDELIKADEGARNELTEIDKKDAEEIERRRSRSSAISPRLLG